MLIQTFPDPGKIRHALMNIVPGFFSEKGSTLPLHNLSFSCAAVFFSSPNQNRQPIQVDIFLNCLSSHLYMPSWDACSPRWMEYSIEKGICLVCVQEHIFNKACFSRECNENSRTLEGLVVFFKARKTFPKYDF